VLIGARPDPASLPDPTSRPDPASRPSGPPPPPIAVLGEGPVAAALCAAIAGAVAVTDAPDDAQRWSALIAVGPEHAEKWWRDLNLRAVREGLPLVPVRRGFGALDIGPVVVPGEHGCLSCALARGTGAVAAGSAVVRARERRLRDAPPVPHGAFPRPVLDVVAALVADEVAALRSGRAPRTSRAVLRVSSATLAIRRHAFLPRPACAACGGLPPDTPQSALVTIRARPKASRSVLRVRPVHTDQLLDRYVDERTGVVAGVDLDVSRDAPICTARVSPTCGDVVRGYGRTIDRSSNVAVAVLEGLERRAGHEPGGKRTMVRASFAELGPERAIDPTSLGLPALDPPPSTRYVRYSPDTTVNWVYGYSFRRERALLVPEAYAYYATHGDPLFAFECSNGCALGGSLEEAILHGVLEVAERDAFLATWYARMPVPRINPRTAEDTTVRLLVDRIERATGLAVHVFDTTMPEGVPTLWIMLVDEDDRPGHPKALCSAAAGLDPEAALRSALLECVTAAEGMRRSLAQPETVQRARAMLHDGDLVTSMSDHSLLYALPEAWPRLAFLYRRTEVLSLAEAFPVADRYVFGADLADDLRYVLDRYLRTGLDVIVVDQTTDELRAAELSCVKVIIPGTLSMTFGHRHRRAEGLERLRTAPVRLGHRTGPMPDEEVNPHPHPFP
jgi:ribosomal protein S12 methylthiotransferase accessory factor